MFKEMILDQIITLSMIIKDNDEIVRILTNENFKLKEKLNQLTKEYDYERRP